MDESWPGGLEKLQQKLLLHVQGYLVTENARETGLHGNL
jgi:hypothetical protein